MKETYEEKVRKKIYNRMFKALHDLGVSAEHLNQFSACIEKRDIVKAINVLKKIEESMEPEKARKVESIGFLLFLLNS